MKRVLLTGATGFIGRALTDELIRNNINITTNTRTNHPDLPPEVNLIETGDINASTDWSMAIKKIDTVIHLAARVHVMRDFSDNPLAEFRKTNVEATLNLAQQAALAGVTRFVFISSIKANEYDPNQKNKKSVDPYGLSKYEAEQGLITIAKKTHMDVVVIRPPLVYGPNVKGNFLSLLKVIQKRIPLPLGAIHNQRSFIAVDNLINFILCCTTHPKATNEIFTISDGEDISTTELLKKIANALNQPIILIPIPAAVISVTAKLLGQTEKANRLLDSLLTDNSKAKKKLGWEPITSMDSQLKKIAKSLYK